MVPEQQPGQPGSVPAEAQPRASRQCQPPGPRRSSFCGEGGVGGRNCLPLAHFTGGFLGAFRTICNSKASSDAGGPAAAAAQPGDGGG